jgi:hypothetical protein
VAVVEQQAGNPEECDAESTGGGRYVEPTDVAGQIGATKFQAHGGTLPSSVLIIPN